MLHVAQKCHERSTYKQPENAQIESLIVELNMFQLSYHKLQKLEKQEKLKRSKVHYVCSSETFRKP